MSRHFVRATIDRFDLFYEIVIVRCTKRIVWKGGEVQVQPPFEGFRCYGFSENLVIFPLHPGYSSERRRNGIEEVCTMME